MSASNRYSVNLSARPQSARPAPARRGRWLTGTALGAAVLAATSSAALAQAQLPGTVTATVGGVSFGANSGTSQTITQTTQRAVINWNDFNVAAGHTLTFNQQLGSSSIVLNRVTGSGGSTINGVVNANGQVWLLNPNGIVVGSTGSINVRGFLGTTHAQLLPDNDFVDTAPGSYTFNDAAAGDGYGNFAEVVNLGTVNAHSGYAVLAGREVRNGGSGLDGNIFADLGHVVLAGAPTFTMNLGGDQLLSFAVSGEFAALSGGNPLVTNTGGIDAVGGRVLLSARAASNVVASVVNMGGNISATTAKLDGAGNVVFSAPTPGDIVIDGGGYGSVDINGARFDPNQLDGSGNPINVGGVLNVNSEIGVAAGDITVSGRTVNIGTTAPGQLMASSIGISAPASGAISISGHGISAGSSSKIQAMAFGGIGQTGGSVVIDASGAGSQVTIAGLVETGVGSDFRPGLMGQRGTDGTAGSIAVEGDSVTLASGAPGGRLIANAGPAGGVGGLIEVAGNSITINGSGLADNVAPSISASGAAAGGTVLVGGGLGGAGLLGRALPTSVTIGGDASLYTEVFGAAGNGGTIAIWSDSDAMAATTTVLGRVSSRSALGSGNGGSIELGGRTLEVRDNARIEAGADGNGGNIRLIGDAITVSTNISVGQPLPVGIFAAGNGGDGGTISIGGETGGGLLAGKPLPTSVTISNTSRMNVRAVGATGNSGRITIWSDSNNPLATTTLSGGQFVGENFGSGNAGLVEIGGYRVFARDFSVTLPGEGGRLRFATHDVDVAFDPLMSSFTGSSPSLIDSVGLQQVLDSGTNVDIAATSFAGGTPLAGNIDISGSILKTTGPDAALTFAADGDVRLMNDIKSGSPTLSPGRLTVGVTAGNLFSFANPNEPPVARSILSNGGNVNIEAATVDVGLDQTIETRNAAATDAGAINIFGATQVTLRGGSRLVADAGNGAAGTIAIGGDDIDIGEPGSSLAALVTASGLTAGTVSIGGGAGGAPLGGGLAGFVTVARTGVIKADGFGTANGGTVNIWSDRNNSDGSSVVYGKVYARSGLNGGNGGTIEIGGRFVEIGSQFNTSLDADARLDVTASVTGGKIELAGDLISIDTNESTDLNPVGLFAWGIKGGGSIAVGGGLDGALIAGQALPSLVEIGETSRFNANAIETGNGGRITIWSDRDNFESRTMLGGSLAVDSGTSGGLIEIGGYNITTTDLTATALGGGSIGFEVGEFGTIATGYGYGFDGYGYGYGFGSGTFAAEGGAVSFVGGAGSDVWLTGVNETGGGALSIATGEGSFVELNGFVGTGGGNFAINAAGDSEIINYGDVSALFDATGGAISWSVGDTGYIDTYGTITTGLNSITLTGGNGAEIYNDGSIASNGGGITLAVGAGVPDLREEEALAFGAAEEGSTFYVGGVFNYGSLSTGGGDLVATAGPAATVESVGSFTTAGGNAAFSIANDGASSSALYLGGFGSTGGGDVTLAVGDRSGVITEGFLETSGGNVVIAAGTGDVETSSGYLHYGTIDTSLEGGPGGSLTVTAGSDSFAEISGHIFTGGGNLTLTHGSNSSIFIDVPDCLECSFGGALIDTGLGDVELTADALGIGSFTFGRTAIAGDDIRLNADTVDIFAPVLAGNSIAVAPRTVDRAINIGDIEALPDALSLDEFELDNLVAPTVVLGRADGTGAVNILLTEDISDGYGYGYGYGYGELASTSIVQAGGVGGTITVAGIGSSSDLETIRLVAGSNVTLAEGLQFAVGGKLELVSGGSFTNNAGAGALTTTGDGQWLIYSANPAGDAFGGLLSGQKALWGQDFATTAANGITHSGNLYAFGLAPTVTVTAVNRTKTYGDTLDLSAALLGRDYTVSGLVDAAAFGGVFAQDSLSGAPTLASSGAAGSADAGSYSIIVAAGTGLSAGNGYNLAFQSASLTVDPRLLTATLAGNVAKVYDGTTAATLAGANYSLAGFVNGDEATVTVANSSGSYDSKDAGTGKSVTVAGAALTGARAGNYVLSSTTLTGAVGTVTPRALTAALTGSVEKVYDATTAAALSGANYSLAGFVAGEGATVAELSGSFASPNVGSNIVVTASLGTTDFAANSGTSLGNYLLPVSASGAIGTITPATLFYVADAASRTQNTANPAFSGSVTGLLGSDTLANATSGTLAFTTPAVVDSPVGSYAINGGGLTAGNYVFTQAPGNASALQVVASPTPAPTPTPTPPPPPPVMQPAQQVTTTVIQQVTSASRTPTPTPTPTPSPAPTAASTPTAPPTGTGGSGTPLAGGATGPVASALPPPPPPPPPPPAPVAQPAPLSTGAAPPPPPGPPVEATPPSPVGDDAPPTPSDSADQGDPVLAEAGTPDEEQDEAPSEKRQVASTTVVVPGVNVEVPVSARPPEVPGADQSFSGSGNPAQW